MGLKKIGCEGVDWIQLAQGRVQGPVAGTCKQGNELSGSINSEEFLDQLTYYY
jgi:hypothetical protein